MSASPGPSQRIPAPRVQRLDSLTRPQPRPLPGARNTQEQAKKAQNQCPNPECRSTSVEEIDGNIICRDCSAVVSDANIVADVQFAEGANGSHIALGTWIGSDQAFQNNIMGLKGANADGRFLTESSGK